MQDLGEQAVKGYEIRERIGAGGFGAVYRAFQPILGREVAIKVVLPEHANRPEFVRRFENEAQLVARLEHPHIVPLYDFWREPNGAFLVMRWIRGGTLTAKLKSEPWDLERTARLLEQIAGALSVAHRSGVVHRDIKPDNILIDQDGNAYLTDFGIALMAGQKSSEEDGISGSIGYMSPEQLRGVEDITSKADIYAMGYVLYEILTGHYVYDGMSMGEIIGHHLSDPIPDPCDVNPDLPSTIHEVLLRATAKEPVDRYDDVREFAVDFRQAISTTHVTLEQIDLIDVVNPYKGLRAFEQADAADFFGREAVVTQLIKRLAPNDLAYRFLAVIGPSGSGKSSLVKAGLLPVLRAGGIEGSDSWFIVDMTLGAEPLKKLEAALLSVALEPPTDLLDVLRADVRGLLTASEKVLADPKAELLLVIDQFEEVFTLSDNEADRTHFLNLIYHAVTAAQSRVRVVITLRADFYDRPLLYENFGILIQSRTQVVLPLSAEELERAISGPALRVGLQVDSDLIAAVVADVREEGGALPLLQHALTEVFERRDGRRLTLRAYQSSGGVLGALARRAEEVYNQLSDGEQKVARQIFLRLVNLNEGSEFTKRRTRRGELVTLEDRAVVNKIVDAFGVYRLLTFDQEIGSREPTVEIAHEALIRSWGQLRAWLENSRSDVRLYRQLSGAFTDWTNVGRKPDYLLHGGRLAQFEEWSKHTDWVLTPDEHEFLQASIAAERSRRRERRLFFIVNGAFICALIALGIAFWQFTQATEARATAQQLSLAANSRVALNNDNSDLAIALALQAIGEGGQTTRPEAERALADAAYSPGSIRLFSQHSEGLDAVVYSPDGTRAASAGKDKIVRLWNVSTGQEIRRFEDYGDSIATIAFSADGQRIAAGGNAKSIMIWAVDTGDLLMTLEGHTEAVRTLAFNPNGTKLLSGGSDLTARLWDLETSKLLHTFEGFNGAVMKVLYHRDLRRALVMAVNTAPTLFDLQEMEEIATYPQQFISEPNLALAAAAFSPDGKTVVTSFGFQMHSWSLEDGKTIRSFIGHGSYVNSIAFSSDGNYILSSARFENAARLWNVDTGQQIRSLVGHTGIVRAVALSPDSRYALTASDDKTARVWDLYNGAEVSTFHDNTIDVYTVAYSPDGQLAASGDNSGVVYIWQMDTHQLLMRLDIGGLSPNLTGDNRRIWSLAFSPDGTQLLTGGGDKMVRLWEAASGRLIRVFAGHTDWVTTVIFSPDGQSALSGANDQTVRLWNLSTGDVRVFDNQAGQLRAIVFSPDATQFLAGATKATLYNLATGEALHTFEGHNDRINSLAFSADGSMILTGSADATLRLWDAKTYELLKVFEGHTAQVRSVLFSPDGQRILSASADATLRVWDIASGLEVRRYVGHGEWINQVVLSPDGRLALTGSFDNTVRLWHIHTLTELFDWVNQNRYVRALSCNEERIYLVDQNVTCG